MKNVCKISTIIISLGLLFASHGLANKGVKTVTIAIFTCLEAENTFKRHHPMFQYLEKKTGLKIRLVFPENFQKFHEIVQDGTIEVALQTPVSYLKLSDHFSLNNLIMALSLDQKRCERGVIIVRWDSTIESLDDLKGKKILFGSIYSAQNWIAARNLFDKRGIKIEKDLKGWGHGVSCEDVVMRLVTKEFEAGVICEYFLNDVCEGDLDLGENTVRVIAKTAYMPNWLLAFTPKCNQNTVKKITQAILNLSHKDNKQYLQGTQFGGFSEVQPGEFQELKRMIQRYQ
ncbi:phosphate/phosphite/phosphonate ABC transporter substrate-binding protein [candidate division CSSED10-310 bacterium]|uniref:Phosphate/phosphite/phosphonate ABC transporter substrate-binding protein n=1 Tax=candidate division CSSED10-310 bacterium TaxID=2855610 RepID=A0ABV6YV23_UNCC1